jgi:hypothetical protein
MKGKARWLWPIWFTIVAVASFLTRDDPPWLWWAFPAALALASWVIELQESMIRDLWRLLGRKEADL